MFLLKGAPYKQLPNGTGANKSHFQSVSLTWKNPPRFSLWRMIFPEVMSPPKPSWCAKA